MLISERIQSLAPANAAFYRLAVQLTDETVKVYPLDLKMFKLGDPPIGVPSGGYTICYYDAGYGPITHANKSIRLDQQSEALLARSAQLSLHMGSPSSYGGATSPLSRLALPAPTPAGTTLPPASPALGHQPEPPHPVGTRAEASGVGSSESIDRELRAHVHAMDLEDRQQEFLKGTLYATELGEAFGRLLHGLVADSGKDAQRCGRDGSGKHLGLADRREQVRAADDDHRRHLHVGEVLAHIVVDDRPTGGDEVVGNAGNQFT